MTATRVTMDPGSDSGITPSIDPPDLATGRRTRT